MYYLYVAFFGVLGAMARYWISIALEAGAFPYNTLFINIIGCFLLAIVIKYLATLPMLSNHLISGLGTGLIGSFLLGILLSIQLGDLNQLLLGTGFMGGFTTFSTFQIENIALCQQKNYKTLFLYVCTSCIFCILLAILGLKIGLLLRS